MASGMFAIIDLLVLFSMHVDQWIDPKGYYISCYYILKYHINYFSHKDFIINKNIIHLTYF
jgi:hypothetical protein